MSTQFQFKKAVKRDARARVALVGPPGSGKSYTALVLARLLAGPNGKIAAVDTEKGSLSKYADVFDFDVLALDSYTHENFVAAHKAAQDAGYAVFLTDSLSHFWMGKDGALEFVDMATKRHNDKMGGWKDFRPKEREMVDVMTGSKMHIIATMRTKTEYVEQTDERGKKKRVKIGLMPVQREGLEYEFDLVAYMDEENTFIVDKTRCSHYKKKAITEPKPADFQPFMDWLAGAKPEEPEAAGSSAPPAPTAKAAAAPPAPTWDHEKAVPGFTKLREVLGEYRFDELWIRHATRIVPGAKTLADLGSAANAAEVYKAILAHVPEGKRPQKKSGPQAVPKPAAAASEEATDIATLISRISDIGTCCAAHEVLKRDLRERDGHEGEEFYYSVLAAEGVTKANEFRDWTKAKRAANKLLARLQGKEVAA